MKLFLRYAIITSFCILSVIPSSPDAQAQPYTEVPVKVIQTMIPQGVSTVISKDNWSLSVNVQNADIVDILGQIGKNGSLEVIARGEIKGKVDCLATGTPEAVLQSFCKDARLTCRKFNGIWFIEKAAATPQDVAKEANVDLNFENIKVCDLVNILAQSFQLNVKISPDIKTNIALIRLTSLTPSQALAHIALTADLDLVEKDKVWTFTTKALSAP